MNEIHRPQECINANCVNMCSIAQYEGFKHWFGNVPEKCPSYKKGKPINVIEELEKIWEEIRALPDINPDYQMDRTIHISRYGVQEIIYNHISELKGGAE